MFLDTYGGYLGNYSAKVRLPQKWAGQKLNIQIFFTKSWSYNHRKYEIEHTTSYLPKIDDFR